MSINEGQQQLSSEEAFELVNLIEMALDPHGLEYIADRILSAISGITQSSSSFLYICDSRLSKPQFFQNGFQPEFTFEIEKLCIEQFNRISDHTEIQPVLLSVSHTYKGTINLTVYPLRTEEKCVGLSGLTDIKGTTTPGIIIRFFRMFAQIIMWHLQRVKSMQELSNLNKYLTVSSMLAQSIDLHELLEITLYSCMEAVSSEASSILLLDDEKKNFSFYQIEGPAKPILMSKTFPADKGIAASVLKTQKSEIINDVHNDPRFYGKIDSESGFHTRNMIAIPLVAGEEKIGVLEVLNKTNAASFTEEERLFLQLIAEEIAFAIRNAKLFDYVVNSYCKQRQGFATCKGCKRPLGSWTPCVKYQNL